MPMCADSLGLEREPPRLMRAINARAAPSLWLRVDGSGSMRMQVASDLPAKERVAGIVVELLARRSAKREVLADDDLANAGLTSLDMVNLMLSVEAEFDLQIPDAAM